MRTQLENLEIKCKKNQEYILSADFKDEIERLIVRLVIPQYYHAISLCVYPPQGLTDTEYGSPLINQYLAAVHAEQFDDHCITILQSFQNQLRNNDGSANLNLLNLLLTDIKDIQDNVHYYTEYAQKYATVAGAVESARNELSDRRQVLKENIKDYGFDQSMKSVSIHISSPEESEKNALCYFSQMRAYIKNHHALCDSLSHAERREFCNSFNSHRDDYSVQRQRSSILRALSYCLSKNFPSLSAIREKFGINYFMPVFGKPSRFLDDTGNLNELNLENVLNVDRALAEQHALIIREIGALEPDHIREVRRIVRSVRPLSSFFVTNPVSHNSHATPRAMGCNIM